MGSRKIYRKPRPAAICTVLSRGLSGIGPNVKLPGRARSERMPSFRNSCNSTERHIRPPRRSSSPMLARNKVPDQVSVGPVAPDILPPLFARVVELADGLDDPGQHQPPEHLVREAARQKRSLPNDTTLHLTGWPNHSSRWARNATGPRGGGELTRQIGAGTPGGAEGTDNPMTHDH